VKIKKGNIKYKTQAHRKFEDKKYFDGKTSTKIAKALTCRNVV